MAEPRSMLGKAKPSKTKQLLTEKNGPLVLDFLFAVTWLEDPSYVLYLSVFTQIHSYFMFTKNTLFRSRPSNILESRKANKRAIVHSEVTGHLPVFPVIC